MPGSKGPIVETKYWHRLEDGRVQCDVCPRFCTLQEGQRGLCFVRAREGDAVVLTTYGRSCGFCVDPIEKKPLNHFLPGTAVLSFGTAGCNLSCKFCQNWDISKSREIDEARRRGLARADRRAAEGARLPQRRLHLQRPDDLPRVRDRRRGGLPRARARAPSRSPPATSARSRGETSTAHIDAANVDLKAFTEKFYRESRGAAPPAGARHPRLSEEPDGRLARDHQPRDSRPQRLGRGDRRDDAAGWSRTSGRTSRCTSRAFHPGLEDARRPPTPPATLSRARRIAARQRRALRVHGQHPQQGGGAHLLPRCGAGLIGRDGYVLTDWNLEEGRCGVVRRAVPRASSRASPGSGERTGCRSDKDFAA